MSKLWLMGGNTLKSRVPPLNPTRILPSFRSFSTEGGEQQQDSSSSSADPLLQSPKGSVFARVSIFTKNMLKTDIIHFFEGCNLSPADVKVEYNRAYNPMSMMVQFASQSDFDSAFRITVRNGRLYKFEKMDRTQWEILPSYDGKSVLLQGIPRNALPEDVERFLAGSNFDPNFQIFAKPIGLNGLISCAVVRFPTPIDAMSTYLTKNNSFCRNNPVTMKVLQ